ncbi:hypothetical protein P8C59_000467 [Phyllachora maydis]|uniref:Uncharacterized protein n=1 Tax=Phyllachora maydis TaxID=1825666 RepID=A0AAD9HW74_9PEZI|nr:hypothetical protein P8C59_000467 [Phyllachora maydis]
MPPVFLQAVEHRVRQLWALAFNVEVRILLGVDIWAVPFPQITPMLVHGYVILLLYLCGSFWVRMAITLFYLRIVRDQSAEPILIGSFIVTFVRFTVLDKFTM